jgi:hypothetical protein
MHRRKEPLQFWWAERSSGSSGNIKTERGPQRSRAQQPATPVVFAFGSRCFSWHATTRPPPVFPASQNPLPSFTPGCYPPYALATGRGACRTKSIRPTRALFFFGFSCVPRVSTQISAHYGFSERDVVERFRLSASCVGTVKHLARQPVAVCAQLEDASTASVSARELISITVSAEGDA